MSVTCVTIGDEDVHYRVVVGQGTLSVGIKHIELRETLVDEKKELRPFERLVHIEGRNYNG